MGAAGVPAGTATPANPTPPNAGDKKDVLDNTNIDISYEPVRKRPDLYQYVYDQLKGRHALEELQHFLAPLRLPRKLQIKTLECGIANSCYNPQTVTVNISRVGSIG